MDSFSEAIFIKCYAPEYLLKRPFKFHWPIKPSIFSLDIKNLQSRVCSIIKISIYWMVPLVQIILPRQVPKSHSFWHPQIYFRLLFRVWDRIFIVTEDWFVLSLANRCFSDETRPSETKAYLFKFELVVLHLWRTERCIGATLYWNWVSAVQCHQPWS